MLYIIIFVIFLKFSSSTLVGICNECLPSNNVTCINENHFAICINGLPSKMITSCPGNSVCTDDIQICRSPEEGFSPICYQDYCGNCDKTNGVFSCLDETTYAYCFGENFPYEESIRSCPGGYICNYNFPDVCVPADMNEPSCLSKATTTTEISTISTESTTDDFTTKITTDSTSDTTSDITTKITTDATTEITIDSTTTKTTTEIKTDTTTVITTDSTTETASVITTDSTTDATSEITTDSTTDSTSGITTDSTTPIITPQTPIITTTSAPRHPNDICEEIAELGYFKSDDPTCRQYIYCYSLSGQYLGWFYYCDGYFNAETQKCQAGRPLDCVEY